MRPVLAALTLLLTLGACAPLSLYYKPGVPVMRLQDDQLACEVAALKQAPVAIQRLRTPPRYIPPQRYCDARGRCWTEGGYWEDGLLYTTDVNADLRERLEVQCMAKRGYRKVDIPQCSPGVQVSGTTSVLPELTAQSCAVVNPDGSFAIVTGPR
jgi:hypothetical protein